MTDWVTKSKRANRKATDWLLLKLEKEVKDLERELEASQAEARDWKEKYLKVCDKVNDDRVAAAVSQEEEEHSS